MERSGALALEETQHVGTADDVADIGDRHAGSLVRAFEQAGTLVRLARHQQLAVTPTGEALSYLVRSGCVALETAVPARHILDFLAPGDLCEQDCLPALPNLALRAIEASELWRLRQKPSKPLFSELPEIRTAHRKATAAAFARTIIASTMLAMLSGEARVSLFLLSLAARLGRQPANRISFLMPMSRTDIADHLGLNADTLSRIFTSLKEAGLIETQGRHTLTIRNVDGLKALTPIADALLQD